MKRSFFIILLTINSIVSFTQDYIRIHHKDGNHSDMPVNMIDSITFVSENEAKSDNGELAGSWLWDDTIAGYYELLTFNSDHTYIGYDNYFIYGFDTTTYGFYLHHNALITLQSNGFGYRRKYTWFIMGVSDEAFEVMTNTGSFVYYKLQPEFITLSVGESLECHDKDRFIFADGVTAAIVNNALQGLSKGTTYIEKYVATKDAIVAYKVVVE